MSALNHNHTGYDNRVLQTKFEDQYNSRLDLMQFCTVDDSLVGVAGDKVQIGVYTATDGTETLKMGEGNTKNIEVDRKEKEYVIKLLQNRFPWYDEEKMRDPKIIEKGLQHMSVDMFNTANGEAMGEFGNGTLEVDVTSFDFNSFVDGVALFGAYENMEDAPVFAFVNKFDLAEIRKNLGDTLKFVEAYVRNGYIGTVAGVNLYTSNIATEGTIILATKKAVTYYSKTGSEIAHERTDENKRLNTMYSRKYGIFALTDDREVVRLVKGA